MRTGFLPVWYNALSAKYKTPSGSVHLTETAEELEGEEAAVEDGKLTPQPRPMTGWAILLMWIPAACDLLGTVVCFVADPRFGGRMLMI